MLANCYRCGSLTPTENGFETMSHLCSKCVLPYIKQEILAHIDPEVEPPTPAELDLLARQALVKTKEIVSDFQQVQRDNK